MNTIGLILARGGSLEITNKNLKLLGGKPLLAWTFEAAIESNICDEIWIATDDKEISQLAQSYELETFYLPESMVAYNIYSAEAAGYVLSSLCVFGKEITTMIFLQATSPFRTGKNIAEAYALYRGLGTVIGVSQKKKYYWRNDLNDTDKSISPVHASHAPRHRKVRQLTDPHDWFYEENGSVYIVNIAKFLKENTYHIPPYIPYIMPEEESLQIDTSYDWWLAEKWLEYKYDLPTLAR